MPKTWIRKNSMPILMAGLSAVLLLLAGLQYRWIGEISEADRDRLRHGLGVAAEQFRRDFNRELTGAASAFRMRPNDIARHDWTFLADDLARWTDSGPVGLRIDALYIQEKRSNGGPPRTLQLLRGDERFEEATAPREVQAVFDAWPRPFGRGGGPPRGTYWTFVADTPALITPLISRSPGDRGRGGNGRDVHGELVVVFNQEALLGSLLPEIESRFVPANGQPHYQLAVIDAKTSQTLFANAKIPAADFLNAELQLPLVYTVEELIARFAARRGRPGGPDGPAAGSPLSPSVSEQGPDRFFSRAVVASAPDRDGWVLAARHSGGSLDEVVSGLRTRNLAISFGILLLLSVGLALALLSAQRAEKLAQLQMEFVAGVSHELRTPISVIRQAADNLAEGVISSSEQTREYGRLMRAEGRRLTNMVEQTLQFASSQAGKQRYSIETLAPADLMELAVAESRSEIAESGIELSLDVPPDLPSVRGDSSAVMQCLRNLISNAVKYGGRSRKISLTAAVEGRFVRFDVSDYGLGISPEDLPHIFEPFYRGRQAVDAQIQGSGLGLSLAKEAAEASGGTLTAVSRLSSGSTFSLRLPVATVQEASS